MPQPAPPVAAAPGPVQAAGQPKGRPRSALVTGAGDMVRSLLVIMALVVGIVLLVPRPTSVPRAAVDLPAAASAAADQLGVAPAVGVPSGWTVTSTRVRSDTAGLTAWSVNYLTAQGRYVGLEQVAGWDPRWLTSVSQGGTPQGTTTVDGRQWSVYLKAEKRITSLLLRGSDRSTLVLAQVGGLDDARALAASLTSGL